MIVDTSAVLAIYLGEPESDVFLDHILRAEDVAISVEPFYGIPAQRLNTRRSHRCDFLHLSSTLTRPEWGASAVEVTVMGVFVE